MVYSTDNSNVDGSRWIGMGEELKNINPVYFLLQEKKMQKLQRGIISVANQAQETKTKMEFLGKEIKNTFSCAIPKNQVRQLEKRLGIQRITKKRAKKLLMSKGYQRNQASIMSTYVFPRTLGRVQQFPSLIES